MTPDDAARIAEEFLEEFVLDDAYASKSVDGEERERLVYVQHVEPRPGEVHVVFGLESEDFDAPDDPEVQSLAQAAVDALGKAHPELSGMRLTFSVI
jgi:hypothetical protein